MQPKENKKEKHIQGNFITNLKELESQPGYYSAKHLHAMNTPAHSLLNNSDLLTPIMSQLLTSGNYYVPAYMSLYGKNDNAEEENTTTDEEEEEEEEEPKNGTMKKDQENITITISPIEKCSDKIIDEKVYNTLIDLVNGKEQKSLSLLASFEKRQKGQKGQKNNTTVNVRKYKSTRRNKLEKRKETKKYKKN